MKKLHLSVVVELNTLKLILAKRFETKMLECNGIVKVNKFEGVANVFTGS